MYDILLSDKNDQTIILEEILRESIDYIHHLNEGEVSPKLLGHKSQSIPDDGLGTLETLKIFSGLYKDSLVKSSGSRYFGFVIGGSTPAAIAGDWLTSVFDQNAFGIPGNADYYIESEAVKLLRELIGLPEEFFATFVSGATMANFVGLSLAREWAAKELGINISEDGLYKLDKIKIVSACAHSSVYKALSMLGMGRKTLITINHLTDREAIDIDSLKSYLDSNKGLPIIVVANLGTVNTGDFDDLESIVMLKNKYNFWLHVDAAFSGIAACSSKYKHLFMCMENADSITIDTHKWLNTPYDGAVQFSKHKELQYKVFNNNVSYLSNNSGEPALFNLTPENSRRFRALPVWFTLMAYGKRGYQEIIERNCSIAEEFGEKIKSSGYFKLLSPVKLNIVCFTLNYDKISTKTIKLFLEELNKDGKTFLTETLYQGIPAMRIAVSNWMTTNEDACIAWKSLLTCAEKIKEKK